MSEIPLHSVSVAGIVFNDSGEVLVIKRRDNGHWEPPGGVLELAETVQQGVQREILEETGITVDVGPLTGVYKNMQRGVVALVFQCTAIAGTIRPTDESAAVEWMEPGAAMRKMEPAFAIRVNDALHPNNQVIPRAHDGVKLLGKRYT